MNPMELTSHRARWRETLGWIQRWVREKGLRSLAEFAVNLGVPFLTYRLTHPSLGDVGAMMAASAAPMAWAIIEFVRRRRVDALSLIVLAGIGLSLIGFLGGGGVRFVQLREHLVAAVIGLIFLASAAIGKPLIYQLARARLKRLGATSDLGTVEGLRDSPIFRRAMMTMTLVWGAGLVAESALSCSPIFVMTIQQFMLAGWVVGTATIGGLTAWTFWYANRRTRAAIAAANGRAQHPPPRPHRQ
jgi:hypothetical protein